MGLLGTMVVRFSADTTQLNAGISSAQTALSSFGASASMLGPLTMALAAAGVAAVGIGASSVQAAGDFQTSMTKISAYAGMSKQDTDNLAQSVMALSGQVAQSPKALADALYPIVSSGYSASQALDILKLSAQTAAASGADTTTVASGLTTALKAFSLPASQATNVMDGLNKTVAQGKMDFSTLAPTIGKLSQLSAAAHVPLTQMEAALDTLSSHGFPSTAQASTGLQNLFTQLSIKTDALQKHAQTLGLQGFNATKFAAMDLGDKIQYLTQATHGNEAALLKMLGGSRQAYLAFKALQTGSTDYKNALAGLNNAQGTTADVFKKASDTYNFQVKQMQVAFNNLQIVIGNALIPVINGLMSKITPIISGFAQWISTGNNLKNLLSTIAPIIAGVVVTAFTLWAISAGAAAVATIAATWPILLIAAAIGVLVGAFIALYNNSAPFRAFIQQVQVALQQVWQFLVASFTPVWQFLVNVIQTQVMPAWNQMVAAIQPLMPQLQQLGQIIVGVVGVAFTILMGIIGGVIGAISGAFTGLTVVIGGITTFIAGTIQFWQGIFSFFIDLVTGKFDKLGADLGNIWGGIVKMFSGVWDVIRGLFISAINGIIGLVNGFVAGVLGPINAVLKAAGQSPITVGQIPLISGNFLAIPGTPGATGYQSPISSNQSGGGQQPGGKPGGLPTMPTLPTGLGGQPPISAAPLSQTGPMSPVTNAINAASGKSAAAAQKAQDAANARAARLADTQANALKLSSSSAVKSLIAQSQAAAKAGDPAMAAFYAHKASVLAHQQHAAQQRAAHAAASAARHQQHLALMAQHHADALKRHAQHLAAMAARHKQAQTLHEQRLAAAAARHAQAQATRAARQAQAQQHHLQILQMKQQAAQTKAQQHQQHLNALHNINHSIMKIPIGGSTTIGGAAGGSSGGAMSSGGSSYSGSYGGSGAGPGNITIVVELDGRIIGQAVSPEIVDYIRVKTGMKI